MTKTLKLSVLGLLLAAAAFAFAAVLPSIVYGHEGEDHSEEVAQAETNEDEEQSEEQDDEDRTPYSYTAQPGDSYTKIARKAVQTYGVINDVNLSGAEIVAAETFLTADANFPALSTDEKVELSADAVKAAVEKAQALDDAAEARWEKYVANVDFNTNAVGEARS